MIRPDTFEGLSIFRPPLVYELTGRRFELVMDDGFDRTLYFTDRKMLRFGPAGEEKEYAYECLKSADDCYFVNFEDLSMFPRVGITLVLDLEQDLVTMALAYLGQDPKIPKMPASEFVFGGIRREDGSVQRIRHGYTSDLVGKSIDWYYGSFNIAHVYATERYYRVAFTPRAIERIRRNDPTMFQKPPEGAPADIYEDYLTVIKIKDQVYLVGLLETILARRNGHGASLLVLMDLNEMHDVGRSFNITEDGKNENYLFGAFGCFYDASGSLAKKSGYHIR